MKKYVGLLITVIALNVSQTVIAQITFSPYTISGIGDISSTGLSNNFGMGGVGIAAPTVWHINSHNPALLTYNSLTVFQMGVAGERRTIDTETSSSQSGSGGIRYIAFAFPIKPNKWTSSVGVMPYSSSNYNALSSNNQIAGTTDLVSYNRKGSGGLTRVYFANGFTILKKINFGFRASYLFGSIEDETISDISNEEGTLLAPFRTAIFEKTTYGGFKMQWGLAYKHKLSEKSFLHLGLVYESKADLDGERFRRLERKTATDRPIPGDTIPSVTSGAFNAPSQLGFGISWEKKNKITLSLDYKQNRWESTPLYNDNTTKYINTNFIGFGMEFIPDYTSISSYLKRIRYRLGFSTEQLPYLVQNEKVNDYGINFGWSLPVGVSSVDFAFKYGQRGTTANQGIRERYVKVVIGATINDRWFVRRKYD